MSLRPRAAWRLHPLALPARFALGVARLHIIYGSIIKTRKSGRIKRGVCMKFIFTSALMAIFALIELSMNFSKTELSKTKIDRNVETVLLASVGNDITDHDFDRYSFTDPIALSLVKTQKNLNLIERNTFFVDCGEKQRTPDTGVLLDLSQLPLSVFPSRDAYSLQCGSKILLSAAHVLQNSNNSGGCIISHKEKSVSFKYSKLENIWVNPLYNETSDYVDDLSLDYGFVKLTSAFPIEHHGLPVCGSKILNKTICSPDNTSSAVVSQAYGLRRKDTVISGACCIDNKKKPLSKLLAHTCHTQKGASGGGILHLPETKNGDVCLIGIHVGAGSQSRHNYGVPMLSTKFQSDLRAFLDNKCL